MRPSTVLILDDEPHVATVIAETARRCGLQPVTARTAAGFFRSLEVEQPGRIVLDLAMPDVDGVEIIRRLGASGSDAGVVIVSGLGPRVVAAAARLAVEQGLDLLGTLGKPFRIEPLMAVLARTPRAALAGPWPGPEAMPTPICNDTLADAVHDGSLGVVFQPKIACRDRELVGFEALAQWRRPDGHLVPAEQFVTLAEQSALIGPLTERVVAQALDWFRLAPRTLTLALNVSARSLDDHGLVDRMLAACAGVGIDPSRIVLEITETAAMVDPVVSLDVLTRMRVRGFRVSIDDFGVGHASVAQLARLPFSELKIDRGFVRDLDRVEENRSIVRALVGLGHSLGLTVAAEGVETPMALAVLAEIGCDHAQGFHVAPPLDGAAALDFAAARGRRRVGW